MTQFSNITQNDGLIQKCEFALFGDNGLTQISNDSDRLQMFTNFINEGYSNYINLVIKMDGRWQFDDSTYTDYTIATTNIVSGQSDYVFNSKFIQISSMEVLLNTGEWKVLIEADESEYAQIQKSMTQEFITSGVPTHFNRTANSVFLLPTPNFNSTAGLKVRYQRPPNYFTYGDTGKEAGFSTTHHDYLVDYACMKYATMRTMDSASTYVNNVFKWENIIIPALYSRREKDVVKKLVPLKQNNK